MRVGDVLFRVPVIAPAADHEETDRLMAHRADGRVQDRGPIELPVVFIRVGLLEDRVDDEDRKSTRLNSSHMSISYAVFCLKKKKTVDEDVLGAGNVDVAVL